jgi:hypothetical protein
MILRVLAFVDVLLKRTPFSSAASQTMEQSQLNLSLFGPPGVLRRPGALLVNPSLTHHAMAGEVRVGTAVE